LRWLLGALVLLANWPYTIFVMMPTNRHLMNTPPTRHDWAVEHSSRGQSGLGLIATVAFLLTGQ